LLLPTQLYQKVFDLKDINKVYIYEHPYYFEDFNYHKQKLILHRASMKAIQNELINTYLVEYINFDEDLFSLIDENHICMFRPADSYIQNEFIDDLESHNFTIEYFRSPKFFNTEEYNKEYFKRNKLYHHSFYIEQRKRLNILLEGDKPVDRKWSFDSANRKKFPKNINIKQRIVNKNKHVQQATEYVEENFSNNPGETNNFIWPINHKEAVDFFEDFLDNYLKSFGPYQDAFDEKIDYGFHSLISVALNIGIITPNIIVNKIIDFYRNNNLNIESIEGFIRQIIGWREYVKAVYELNELDMKNSNYFNLIKRLPDVFYTGKTKIKPVDVSIDRVSRNAYTHHIERLMVLGNIMLLLNIEPGEVYNWFMELFIDGYDWVMTPNIYGMSQFAYPRMMTKPYISSSNYILKMSHYQKKEWAQIWDGLYWNFITENKKLLSDIQRMNLILNILNKMDKKKIKKHRSNAYKYQKEIFRK